jgi:hypothetical protein
MSLEPVDWFTGPRWPQPIPMKVVIHQSSDETSVMLDTRSTARCRSDDRNSEPSHSPRPQPGPWEPLWAGRRGWSAISEAGDVVSLYPDTEGGFGIASMVGESRLFSLSAVVVRNGQRLRNQAVGMALIPAAYEPDTDDEIDALVGFHGRDPVVAYWKQDWNSRVSRLIVKLWKDHWIPLGSGLRWQRGTGDNSFGVPSSNQALLPLAIRRDRLSLLTASEGGFHLHHWTGSQWRTVTPSVPRGYRTGLVRAGAWDAEGRALVLIDWSGDPFWRWLILLRTKGTDWEVIAEFTLGTVER